MPGLAPHCSGSIRLPEIGVSMDVLATVGDRIRVDLRVPECFELCGDVHDDAAASVSPSKTCTHLLSRQEFHDLKNDLHAIRLTLHLFHRQEQAAKTDAAAKTFERLARQVGSLQALVARADECA